PSLFVVKGKAKRISEGGQRPLGGIRLGGLERNLMRRLCRSRSADTGADTLAHDDGFAGAHRYADLTRVKTGRLPTLRFPPQAARRQRLPIPTVVPKDAIGLGNDVPTFDVANRVAVGRARLNVAIAQFG